MRRGLALLWLLLVLAAASYLGSRLQAGLPFRADLLALLPREEHDPARQRAHEAMSESLSRRILLLVGHDDRQVARHELERLEQALLASGAFTPSTIPDRTGIAALAQLYARHYGQLLAETDRAALLRQQPEQVTARALAQIFNPVMPLSAGMLRQDPFLLLPAFLTELPAPSGRALLENGRLSVSDVGSTWYLLELHLNGAPTDLDVQERAVAAVAASQAAATMREPGLRLLRLGVVFFAEAGAQSGLRESSWLGGFSFAGTALMLLLVFHSAWPLLHNLLAAGIGILVGLAGSLWLFGELHVGTLLFGAGLIGVVVDYSLHYSATAFDPAGGKPEERIRRIWTAMWLGLATTLLGYAALSVAPLPGLRQIAVFSMLGLIAAFLCVLLWLPLLDRQQARPREGWAYRLAARLWPSIAALANSRVRWTVLAVLVLLAAAGLLNLRPNDDVRRLQALSPDLVRQQQEIRQLLGGLTEPQFLLVQAGDDEAALRLQEEIRPRLEKLRQEAVLDGFTLPASFLPSAARQNENRRLVDTLLEPAQGAVLRSQLGLPPTLALDATAPPPLTWEEAEQAGALGFIAPLRLWPGGHAILLQGLHDSDALHRSLADQPGVMLIDPAGDFSRLLQRYRERVEILLAISCLLLLPLLAWRYGWRGACWLALPPMLALALAPGLLALLGHTFTLFHAMALVLILSIGIDYAIFIAESDHAERPVALLGTVLATLTTQLSFGLLALSSAPAVAGFGLTMLIGITIACLLSPLAGAARQMRQHAMQEGQP